MKRILSLLALFALVPLSLSAQTAQSKSALYTEINASLAGGSAITAATLRTVLKDVVASSHNPLTDGAVQPYSASLVSIASQTTPGLFYLTSSGTWQLVTYLGATFSTTTGLFTVTSSGGPGGGGDLSSNTTVSVDSEMVVFSGTAGKTVKRMTGTGVAHLTSGVASVSNVVLGSEVTGILPKANGGTGATGIPDKMGVTLDGSGSVLTTGLTSIPSVVPYDCTITGWYLTSSVSGSLVIDIRKQVGGSGSFTTIITSAPPTLTSAAYASSNSVSTWTVALTAGDVVKYVITGTPATVTDASLTLKINR